MKTIGFAKVINPDGIRVTQGVCIGDDGRIDFVYETTDPQTFGQVTKVKLREGFVPASFVITSGDWAEFNAAEYHNR